MVGMMMPPGAAGALNEQLVLAFARARARGAGAAYQIAARAGVHPSEVSRWMNGHRAPSPDQAQRLASALDCEVEDIFPANAERPNRTNDQGAHKLTDQRGQHATVHASAAT